jgi:choice-of-anchor C domain-containing protein
MPHQALTVAAALLASAAAASAQSILVNGSFEEGQSPGNYLPLNPGSTAITGWTVTRAQIDYIGGHWQHADGLRSVDLDGTPGNGGISQTFATTPGASYRLQFSMAGNPVSGPLVKRMRVTVGDFSHDYEFDITGHSTGNMGWVSHSDQFTAAGAQATIEFFSLTGDPGSAYGPTVDNVVVTASCYANCDLDCCLDIFDFLCFQNRFNKGAAYACDCDTGSGPGVCDIFDFICFQNAFGAGCP